MKVVLRGGRLLRIGEQLPLQEVNAEALGFYVFRGDGPRLYRETLEEMIREPEGLHQWFPAAIDRLARRVEVKALDLTGFEWCEVDYPTDLKLAREYAARWDAEGNGCSRPRLVKP